MANVLNLVTLHFQVVAPVISQGKFTKFSRAFLRKTEQSSAWIEILLRQVAATL